jgi:hypothetical protein
MFALLLAAILFFTSSDTLARRVDEPFFDYVCRIKNKELSAEETLHCRYYLKDPNAPLTPYLQTVQNIFREQIIVRLGKAAQNAPTAFVDKKVSNLMRIFLKDKLGLHTPIQARHDLAERAKWDPHYHGSSLFADYFPKARLYLPNFHEGYMYIKHEKEKLDDRMPYIEQAMEELSFSAITEAATGNASWHFTHVDKQIVPILAHARTKGPILHHEALGYDVCGTEEEDGYQSQKAFFQSLQADKVVRVHVGETLIPASGKENVHRFLDEAQQHYASSKPLRIGHGTHIGIEDMLRIAEKGYYIEACLSSNKRLGILDKRSDYPLGMMLLLGVNVVIGTDGGRLYSTTLPEEYAYAVRNLEKFQHKLKTSDAPILLPNGDALCYKHVLPYAQEQREQTLTYKQLGVLLEPAVLERISAEALVLNANRLLKECYPDVKLPLP